MDIIFNEEGYSFEKGGQFIMYTKINWLFEDLILNK